MSGNPQRWILLSLLVATSLLVIALYLSAPDARKRTPELAPLALDVVSVKPLDQRIGLLAWGQAHPAREIPMLAEVRGVITETSQTFVSGAAVDTDSTLVTLADEDYQLALAQRENEVSAAQLHLEEVRARARVASRVNGPQASPYALLKPHLQEAETRLDAARAAQRQAQLQLQRTRIHAPFAGRLRAVAVREGQLVSAGQVLAQLYAPDVMEVRLPVPDLWLSLLGTPLPEGLLTAPVVAGFEARYGGQLHHWHGHVVRVEGGLDRNQMVTLVAQVDAQDGQLLPPPGVWLEARIETRELPALVRLPRSVLGHDNAVWVVSDARQLQRRAVDVLYHDDDWVFLAGGLRQDELVALSGNLRLLEGTPVTPQHPATSDDHRVGALAP